MKIDYTTYLKLPTLLNLQNKDMNIEANHELLFISVHQAEELYFKVLLSELHRICSDFNQKDVFTAISRFERCNMVFSSLISQLKILESLSPIQFFDFRKKLGTASGFQSCQFRELLFVLGFKRREIINNYPRPEEQERLMKVLHSPSLIDYFYRFLHINGLAIPDELMNRDYTLPSRPNEFVQVAIVNLYLNRPDIKILFEKMLDFDSNLQHWRYQHYKLVERAIGNTEGTGGSSGLEFLKKSLFKSIFIDLFAVRNRLTNQSNDIKHMVGSNDI